MAILIRVIHSDANNIKVGIKSYDAVNRTMNISISWDNSWSDGTGAFRDGAYIFIKYRDLNNPNWQHAYITTANDGTVFNDTLSGASVPLVQSVRTVTASGNYCGSVITRSLGNTPAHIGVRNIGANFTVTLAPPTATTSFVNPEFRVYAFEVVDIPQGKYWLDSMFFSSNSSKRVPVQVVSTSSGPYFYPTDTSTRSTGGKLFYYNNETGYNQFFVMKYEVSNEAFCEFLNTLSRPQQNILLDTPAFTNASTGTLQFSQYQKYSAKFNGLNVPAVFGSDADHDGIPNEVNDGQNVGAIVNKGMAIMTFYRWAAMSPISPIMYEKICRGPATPVPFEYAWGSAVGNAATVNVDVNGPGETSSDTLLAGPLINTPIRNGAFAHSNSTRETSGGSYYGVMDLSNSAAEAVCWASFSNSGYGVPDFTFPPSFYSFFQFKTGTVSGFPIPPDTDAYPMMNSNTIPLPITYKNQDYFPGFRGRM